MKVSVIIPVYNVEDYILECLESVLMQDLKEIEIIIVNDGSIDNSISNIKHLTHINRNIKVINKTNGGLSSARNTGLLHATGEYVLFLDSDDYLKNDFLSKLYNEAIEYNLDIACGGNTRFYLDNTIYPRIRTESLCFDTVMSGQRFLFNQLKYNDYRMEVWDDLYKKSFLLENNLFFIENIIHEDEEYTPRVLLAAKRVKLVETYGYMYRQRENSIMSSMVNSKHISSIEWIINSFIENFERTNIEVEKVIYSKLCSNMFNIYIGKLLKINIDTKYQFLENISRKRIMSVINYNTDLNLKQRLHGWLFSYTPYLYYKIRYIRQEKG